MPAQLSAESPLTLLTDLYQRTMAQAYCQSGLAEREAVFHLFFREAPFGSGYAVSCGQQPALDFLEGFGFQNDDLDYLRTLGGNDDRPLFEEGFLQMLGAMELQVQVDAMPEGTVAFAQQPILRVQGPLLQCQLLETPLLNLVNFQTLVATKAARICMATGDKPVLEFGLRRAQ